MGWCTVFLLVAYVCSLQYELSESRAFYPSRGLQVIVPSSQAAVNQNAESSQTNTQTIPICNICQKPIYSPNPINACNCGCNQTPPKTIKLTIPLFVNSPTTTNVIIDTRKQSSEPEDDSSNPDVQDTAGDDTPKSADDVNKDDKKKPEADNKKKPDANDKEEPEADDSPSSDKPTDNPKKNPSSDKSKPSSVPEPTPNTNSTPETDSTPTPAPKPSKPSKPQESSEPPKTPEPSKPKTPESSEPPKSPEPSESPKTPDPSLPKVPESSEPPKTSEPSDPPKTPESSDPPKTPEPSKPPKTPSPHPTPEPSEPPKTPEPSEPPKTPEPSKPPKTSSPHPKNPKKHASPTHTSTNTSSDASVPPADSNNDAMVNIPPSLPSEEESSGEPADSSKEPSENSRKKRNAPEASSATASSSATSQAKSTKVNADSTSEAEKTTSAAQPDTNSGTDSGPTTTIFIVDENGEQIPYTDNNQEDGQPDVQVSTVKKNNSTEVDAVITFEKDVTMKDGSIVKAYITAVDIMVWDDNNGTVISTSDTIADVVFDNTNSNGETISPDNFPVENFKENIGLVVDFGDVVMNADLLSNGTIYMDTDGSVVADAQTTADATVTESIDTVPSQPTYSDDEKPSTVVSSESKDRRRRSTPVAEKTSGESSTSSAATKSGIAVGSVASSGATTITSSSYTSNGENFPYTSSEQVTSTNPDNIPPPQPDVKIIKGDDSTTEVDIVTSFEKEITLSNGTNVAADFIIVETVFDDNGTITSTGDVETILTQLGDDATSTSTSTATSKATTAPVTNVDTEDYKMNVTLNDGTVLEIDLVNTEDITTVGDNLDANSSSVADVTLHDVTSKETTSGGTTDDVIATASSTAESTASTTVDDTEPSTDVDAVN